MNTLRILILIGSTITTGCYPVNHYPEQSTRQSESSELTKVKFQGEATSTGEHTVPESGSLPSKMDCLTLETAIEIAEQSHPQLAVALAQIDEARGRTLQAGLMPNPELIGRMESAPFSGQTADDAEYIAGIGQSIPLGNRLAAARRVGASEQELLSQEMRLTRMQIQISVRKALADVTYCQQATRTHKSSLDIAEKGVATAQARFAAGDATVAEVGQAEIERKRAELQLTNNQSRLSQAMEALLNAMGTPHMKIDSIQSSFRANSFEAPRLESLLSRLDKNPVLASAHANIAMQKERLQLAKEGGKPDIGLELAYRRLADSNDAMDIGFRIPLPVSNRNQGRIIETRGSLAAAQARLRDIMNHLQFRVRASHRNLSRAIATALLLRDEIIPQAHQVLERMETRYAAGDVSLADILPLRRDVTALDLDYLEALRDVMHAWAELTPYWVK